MFSRPPPPVTVSTWGAWPTSALHANLTCPKVGFATLDPHFKVFGSFCIFMQHFQDFQILQSLQNIHAFFSILRFFSRMARRNYYDVSLGPQRLAPVCPAAVQVVPDCNVRRRLQTQSLPPHCFTGKVPPRCLFLLSNTHGSVPDKLGDLTPLPTRSRDLPMSM